MRKLGSIREVGSSELTAGKGFRISDWRKVWKQEIALIIQKVTCLEPTGPKTFARTRNLRTP